MTQTRQRYAARGGPLRGYGGPLDAARGGPLRGYGGPLRGYGGRAATRHLVEASSWFFQLPTSTYLIREHLSRHLPTYESVSIEPPRLTYLPTPPSSEGGV